MGYENRSEDYLDMAVNHFVDSNEMVAQKKLYKRG
jgi:hypothetical protein